MMESLPAGLSFVKKNSEGESTGAARDSLYFPEISEGVSSKKKDL